MQYRFYELTGDLPDTLHFRDFEQSRITLAPAAPASSKRRVRLKDEIKLKPVAAEAGQKRIKLHG